MMKNICKKSLLHTLGMAFLMLFVFSCDDNTDTLGMSVMPENDATNVSQKVFKAFSNSIRVDSLVAASSECYLGRVTDPETKATTTCNFLAQFYSLENYSFPPLDQIQKEDGLPVADSVELRLYIYSYYGDSLNSMKIGVYELDSVNVMEENQAYYTNIDPNKYLSTAPDAISKEITFSVADLSLSDSLRYSSDYSKNIHIKLPKSFGTKILRKYYQHPEYFKNSYTFTHYVLPGFYFKVLSGNGTLVNIDISTLSVYFRYTTEDSTYVGVERVAATEEVLQNNYIENKNIDDLINDPQCTYLKTPAGIFTEVELPINDIFSEEHLRDSINSARIVFKRQNNDVLSKYNLPAPTYLLMVLKSELSTFFASKKVPDNYKTYSTNFDSDYNSYTYSNIANLISYLKRYRDKGAGITDSDNATTRQKKIAAWEALNKDWNKVVLVPISVSSSSTSSALTSIRNDFSLTSTRLVGSTNNPISISVIYSRFNN